MSQPLLNINQLNFVALNIWEPFIILDTFYKTNLIESKLSKYVRSEGHLSCVQLILFLVNCFVKNYMKRRNMKIGLWKMAIFNKNFSVKFLMAKLRYYNLLHNLNYWELHKFMLQKSLFYYFLIKLALAWFYDINNIF